MKVGLSKLVQKTEKVWNKITDPNKDKRESKNSKLRNKYKTDAEFRKKCEARRLALSEKRKLDRIKKLSQIKIEKERCFICGRKDKLIDQYRPNYTKSKLVFPLCRRCYSRYFALKKMEGKN